MLRDATATRQSPDRLDTRCAALTTLVAVVAVIGFVVQIAGGTAVATALLGALVPVVVVGALWIAGRTVRTRRSGAMMLPRH